MGGNLSNPRDLFLAELAEMLWVERMLAFEILPELHEQIESQSLAAAVEAHLAETRTHAERLESVFREVGADPSSELSDALEGLRKQHEELSGKIAEPRLRDLAHAAAAARTEHYEIAAYDDLLRLVGLLELDGAKDALEANRKEEQEALEKVEKLAEDLRGELPGA
jgi:ferritin-like metal-binding protein YciE